jgi:tRNA-specific 2-thiouridylase
MGKKVGTHDGALLYTLGERAPLQDATAGPWYVIAKDIQTNTLVVSNERASQAPAFAIRLTEANWFQTPGQKVEAQYRYHGPLVSGTYTEQTFTPDTLLPEPAASGQSLVIYNGDTVVGGGIIE